MSQKESALDHVVNGVKGFPNATITAIRFEHIRDALGVGEDRPGLSWIADTTTARWRQTGYEIEAYGPEGRLRGQTGRIESDQSVLVPWPFAPLSSRERLAIRVRVWGPTGCHLHGASCTPSRQGCFRLPIGRRVS